MARGRGGWGGGGSGRVGRGGGVWRVLRLTPVTVPVCPLISRPGQFCRRTQIDNKPAAAAAAADGVSSPERPMAGAVRWTDPPVFHPGRMGSESARHGQARRRARTCVAAASETLAGMDDSATRSYLVSIRMVMVSHLS